MKQLEQLKTCAQMYLRARPLRWRSTVTLIIDDYIGDQQVLVFSFWVSHLATHQEGSVIFGDRGRFVASVVSVMGTLGIRYVKPVQPVVSQTIGAATDPAALGGAASSDPM